MHSTYPQGSGCRERRKSTNLAGPGKGAQALARWPQTRGAQAFKRCGIGSPLYHTATMGGRGQKIKRKIRPVSDSLDRFEPR